MENMPPKTVAPKTQKAQTDKEKRARHKKLLQEMGDGAVGPEIAYLMNSRYKLLYVTTNEERRVADCFKLISAAENFKLFQWDLSRGMVDLDDNRQVSSSNNDIHSTAQAAVSWVVDQAREDNKVMQEKKTRAVNGYIYMFYDLHHFMHDRGTPIIERLLKEFASVPSACSIVIVSHAFICPNGLRPEVTVVDFPYPSKAELDRSLQAIVKDIPVQYPDALKSAQTRQEDLLNAVSGLTLTEAENAFAKTLVKHKDFNVTTILGEKKQLIRKNGILECRDPRFNFSNIGGLAALKQWLQVRKEGFSEDAAKFGLEVPKGLLLVGVPGTGKSMSCDALASYYEMPLLRLDMGAIFSSLVGESEQNMRNVIKIAEAVAPAILWVDEIEKGIGGVKSSNLTDSGVTNRVFGTLLTWMQDKTASVFVVCTANSVTDIPPEFMRAGRVDEIFFVDLPNEEGRFEVIQCLLVRKQRDPDDFEINKIVNASVNYSPAELEKGINNALFTAFSDGRRPVTTEDVVTELEKFQPLYNSRREEIEAMREWALGEDGSGGRAVLANARSIKSVVKDFSVSSAAGSLNFDITEEDL
jgi:ATP-dependent 26S proteasome regulatory subunit